jgi:hypothetical protein
MENNNRPILEYIQDTIKALCSENGLTDVRTLLQIVDGTLRNIKKSMKKLTTLDIVDVHVSNIIRLIKKLFKNLKMLKKVIYSLANKYLSSRRKTYIIFDDTLIKRYTETAFGTGVFYNHNEKTYITGNDIVSLHQVNDKISISLDYALYLTNDFIEKYNKEHIDKLEFKTKIELAKEMLSEVLKKGLRGYVLGDAWFTCEELIALLRERSVKYILGCKSDKHIVLFGKEKTLKQIFEKIKLRYFHFDGIKYYYAAKTLNIKDWGRHKILAIKTENDDELKYYITNKLNMKPENIWKNYQNRKWIEAFYEDAKEIIGLKKLYMHAKDSVVSYFNFIWYLYNIFAIYRAEKAENGINVSIEGIFDEYNKFYNNLFKQQWDSILCKT